MLKYILIPAILGAIAFVLVSCAWIGGENKSSKGADVSDDASLRDRLTDLQYYVTQKKGTERAFTGEYWNNKRQGVYQCICCGLPLFDSDTKYESGTGWPSFWQPIEPQSVTTEDDYTLFMARTEVKCRRCDAHLGHVFSDGPQPTGQRYCINSASLDFVEDQNTSSSAQPKSQQ